MVNRMRVWRLLTEAGYVGNDCVGMESDAIQSDPHLMARYIAGQVMDCIEAGMAPHPITAKFVEDYKAIAKATGAVR